MRLTRRGRLTVTVSVLVLVVGLVGYVLLRTPAGSVLGITASPPCALSVGEDTLEWSAEQAMTATTVAGVGTRIGATVNGVAAAVADSLRPEPEVPISLDSARQIYRGLPDVANPAQDAIQVAEALLGFEDSALTCVLPLADALDDLPRQDPAEVGLTPRADTVRLEMRAVFGRQVLGGFDPRGVDSGHIDGSAHYEGRAIDVFFRPVTVENQRLGWQQAMWAVAHAERLQVATVIFDREIWSNRGSLEGWREYSYPGGTDNPVLLHEDHVHLDVVDGG